MLKRFSRRAMRSFAVACLTLAVGLSVGAEFANSAVFSSAQTVNITGSSAFNLSQVCQYDISSTGAFVFRQCYVATFGNYFANYQLPFGASYAFLLYDHNLARLTEVVYVYDRPL